MINGKLDKFSTWWVVPAYRSACSPGEQLETSQKTEPRISKLVLSWYICHWGSFSGFIHSYKTSHLYCELDFTIFECGAGFAGKLTSIYTAC